MKTAACENQPERKLTTTMVQKVNHNMQVRTDNPRKPLVDTGASTVIVANCWFEWEAQKVL